MSEDRENITDWQLTLSQRVMAYWMIAFGIVALAIILVGVVIQWV